MGLHWVGRRTVVVKMPARWPQHWGLRTKGRQPRQPGPVRRHAANAQLFAGIVGRRFESGRIGPLTAVAVAWPGSWASRLLGWCWAWDAPPPHRPEPYGKNYPF